MRIQSLAPMLSALAISVSFLTAAPALAETVKLKATLDGASRTRR